MRLMPVQRGKPHHSIRAFGMHQGSVAMWRACVRHFDQFFSTGRRSLHKLFICRAPARDVRATMLHVFPIRSHMPDTAAVSVGSPIVCCLVLGSLDLGWSFAGFARSAWSLYRGTSMAASLHLYFLLETILFSRWIHPALSDIGLLVFYSGILISARGWPRTLAALRPWQQTRRLVMLPSRVVVEEEEASEHSPQDQHDDQYHEHQWRDP